MMSVKEIDVGGKKEILLIGANYAARGFNLPKATTSAPGLAVQNEKGRWIVKIGTIYPANDSTAVGIIAADYDVTDSDRNVAVITAGTIRVSAMPAAPSAAANTAIKNIEFVASL
jgi:Tfp pilus tip-associated adhesin PilY1